MSSENIVLKNGSGLQITLNALGACWRSCRIPVGGELREILLGSHDEAQYQAAKGKMGATCGRYAGRIAGAQYKNVQLVANDGANIIHGGEHNFAMQRWNVVEQTAQKVVFSLVSPDGDNGFPGTLTARATYELTDDDAVVLTWEAETDKETVVNLTNHAYFNLNGDDGKTLGTEQYLRLDAAAFVPVNAQGIPTSARKTVTPEMDFRHEKLISEDLGKGSEQAPFKGYDHSYLVDTNAVLPQAVLASKDHDLLMEILTNQPAIHLYTAQGLGGAKNRAGGKYENYAGIALETQAPGDSPNQHYAWVALKPGEHYKKQTTLVFVAL